MGKAEQLMEFANGEVRIQPVRYAVSAGDYMCLVALVEQEDSFWERFEDMVGGDIEYFDAESFLTNKENWNKFNFTFCYGHGAIDALNKALAQADKIAG